MVDDELHTVDSNVGEVLGELRNAFAQADAELTAGAQSNSAHTAAPADAHDGAQWAAVNLRLQHAGYLPLELDTGPSAAAVCAAVDQILSSNERLTESLQQALEDGAVATQQARRATSLQQATADEELQRANRSLENQLEIARNRLKLQAEEAEAAAHTAQQTTAGLRHKLATQTHQLKLREAETRRLQERLSRELSERDDAQKQRERQIFQEVHRRAAKPSSAADTRGLELISVYEARRRNMQAEIDDLRAASQKLGEDLRERENLIARKDAFRSWKTPDEGVLLGKLQEAQRGEDSARSELQQSEARAAEQLRVAHLAASQSQREADAERARCESLILELEARPTIKQYTDAQATIERLRAALPGDVSYRGMAMESAPAPTRHFESTAEAMRRDREMHDLGLESLKTLPPATMLQLLQDSCRELQLRDAALLPSALRKMCRALAALPPMEAFVREVCALALSRGAPHDGAKGMPSTKVVLQVLQSWARELASLQKLQDFVTVLSATLAKRGLSSEYEVSATNSARELRDIAYAVEDLVQQERKALSALETFHMADKHIESQLKIAPSDLLARLCSHFGRLFELRSTEGMLPKMNELYLFVHEQKNLLKVLRSMVGKEDDASAHAVISALRQALDAAGHSAGAEAAHGEHPTGSPAHDAPQDRVAAADASASHYVAVAAELRKLTHAPSLHAVVPAVKDMQQHLLQYKQSHAQLQGLISQLCVSLSVDSAEAVIAERMRSLTVGAAGDD